MPNVVTEKTASGLLKTLARVEDVILVLLLTLMICLAVSQIFLRNFFQYGFTDGDNLLRILVLWVGLFGAIVASRERKNISIDILSRYLKGRPRALAGVVVDLFVALVAATLAYHSVRLVLAEYDAGTMALTTVPTWLVQSVMPFAFGMIAVRYTLFTVMHARSLITGVQQS